MSGPIKPSAISSAKAFSVPEEVYDAFNELIIKNWNGRSAIILQKEVVKLIVQKLSLENSDLIFNNHWLDIEDAYRKIGWRVMFYKPVYCETYEASFEFSKGTR